MNPSKKRQHEMQSIARCRAEVRWPDGAPPPTHVFPVPSTSRIINVAGAKAEFNLMSRTANHPTNLG